VTGGRSRRVASTSHPSRSVAGSLLVAPDVACVDVPETPRGTDEARRLVNGIVLGDSCRCGRDPVLQGDRHKLPRASPEDRLPSSIPHFQRNVEPGA
jgi:hypothetical protein